MPINALKPHTPTPLNEAPPAAAKALSPSTSEMLVEREKIAGEQAKVKLTEAETAELKNQLWQLQVGVHNGMSKRQLEEVKAKMDAIERQLTEGA